MIKGYHLEQIEVKIIYKNRKRWILSSFYIYIYIYIDREWMGLYYYKWRWDHVSFILGWE